MEGRVRPLDRDAVRGILQRGGTILGTSRRDPYVHGEGAASVRATRRAGAARRARRRRRRRDAPQRARACRRRASRSSGCRRRSTTTSPAPTRRSASTPPCRPPTEAIDRITTTAESHDRVMVVEVMGRTCGWIATYAGIAAGADAILVPEEPYDLDAVADAGAGPGRARPPLLRGRRGRGDRAAAGARALPRRSTRSASNGSAAWPRSSPPSSSAGRGSRRGSRCSGTSSGAARRLRRTASSARASASPRPTSP